MRPWLTPKNVRSLSNFTGRGSAGDNVFIEREFLVMTGVLAYFALASGGPSSAARVSRTHHEATAIPS
jgi:hypothetical protein